MIVLKVAYAEKDQAKALGARWNPTRKAWYIPEGKPSEPFARWIVAGSATTAAPERGSSAGNGSAGNAGAGNGSSRDAHGALPVVGKHFVAIEHACNPFLPCPRCQPVLIESGWLEAQQLVRRQIAAL